MTDSANPDPGLRERKRAATRTAITAAARDLTSARGLNGYTVEEVCEAAGISRRTFFNYFPTKEDAIIGHAEDDVPADVIEEFVAGAAGSPAGEISPTLFQDLVTLSLRLAEDMTESEEETRQLIGVVKKEPQLILRIIGVTEQREAQFARDVARREGVAPDHPVVQMAVVLLSTIARKSSMAYFSDGNTRSYPELLLENISAASLLFSQPFDSTASAAAEGNA
ncbi:transcriptional regulator, TetR family [Pseudarthrobacter chlorophenolicus A6]|uniref:Transcriptional regulator, TetR family n=1 Tax=Pseudarthrobacter chlorophenolicus (strain ATCC 700700 / DSM 12829 / CIP 107037 / JCM 12360 / KCTC 9906 / NCIMB 13794 / A6) TaxID=452863 RepID=B8HEX6_PSECP|nr:TetR/AcrR family transcriptional regulator [Pseudarthrobacter chlorophenolicus]ACL39242.1 transcriptional regulator, TetR family [Pseudarthrobacter chlorophenolicus A6]SDR02315.1 regulatory protein, tetR family [Pseudarthrobacter chlorophenolicus]